MDIDFVVPAGMTPKQLAQKFTAFLREIRGDYADGNRDGAYGPFQMRANSDESWQLDETNDYWLHILDAGHAMLRCRYPRQSSVIEKAMALFWEQQKVFRSGNADVKFVGRFAGGKRIL